MATKKTPTKAQVEAGARTTRDSRPFADSPAPEHCRVDPESALTIVAESKLPPDAPKPVYSTLALANGRDAFGAAHVRPDFAWNPQMDLLWALGYPYCVILVDSGVPLMPMAEQLDLWDTDENVVSPTSLARGIFRGFEPAPRQLASAHLWALRSGKRVTELTDQEWPLAVHFTPQAEDAVAILSGVYEEYLEIASYTLEAFLGPDSILGVLVGLAERHLSTEHNNRAMKALSAMRPLLLRTVPSLREKVLARIATVHSAGDKDVVAYASSLLFPVERARQYPPLGEVRLAFSFDCEELFLECMRAGGPSDVPYVRAVFPGGLPAAKLQCAWFKKYDQQDLVEAYLRDYSTTFRAGMLPGLLTCLSKKDARAMLMPWFEAHRERLHHELLTLEGDPEAAPFIAKGLKSLRW